jgi:hypothetical protein
VSGSELATLKQRTLAFVAETHDASCERIGDTTTNLRGRGCAIYGTPKGGGDCQDVLDGDYFVVFDRATLQPTELVLVAH